VYLFQIHSFHCLVHSLYNIHHASCDLTHRNRRLHSASYRIDPAAQSQEVQTLILLADCVLGVDFRDVVVALLDCLCSTQSAFAPALEAEEALVMYLLQLVLLGLLIFAGFRCLSVQLLRREL
jgi:hypothetical protein